MRPKLRAVCEGVLHDVPYHHPGDLPGMCRWCNPPTWTDRLICLVRGHDDDTDHPEHRFCCRCRRFRRLR